MKKILQYFLGGFATGFVPFFLIFSFFYHTKQAAFLALVIGAIYGLFCVGFRKGPVGLFLVLKNRKIDEY